MVLQMVSNVKALLSETELLLAGKMSMVPLVLSLIYHVYFGLGLGLGAGPGPGPDPVLVLTVLSLCSSWTPPSRTS